MKYLVIGLGSMGKRRIRCLLANGIRKTDILGYDIKLERRLETEQKYEVNTIEDFDSIAFSQLKAAIISTPPDTHMDYAIHMAKKSTPMFIEASVIDDGMDILFQLEEMNQVTIYPSCTMKYFQGPKLLKKIINNNTIGKVYAWQYQSGQYLPDWHPWESITDYYVSNNRTGGCREIVPFELVWLVDLFGSISKVSGINTKLSDINADIDDFYLLQIKHTAGVLGQLMVDVVSRSPIRTIRITGSNGTIEWNDNLKIVKYFTKENKHWETVNLSIGSIEKEYINPEEPYISEIKDFLDCIENTVQPLYTLQDDYKILQILNKSETSSITGETQIL